MIKDFFKFLRSLFNNERPKHHNLQPTLQTSQSLSGIRMLEIINDFPKDVNQRKTICIDAGNLFNWQHQYNSTNKSIVFTKIRFKQVVKVQIFLTTLTVGISGVKTKREFIQNVTFEKMLDILKNPDLGK